MAKLRCDFYSEALSVRTSMTVLLPEGPRRRAELPTLYLLHGLTDDDTAWTRMSNIERHVAGLELAVVMPRVDRSFYTDEAWGRPYWTFVADELPEVAGRMFGLSPRPEDTFVAGLSMGGYGAFKLALRHPDRFGAAASLSGALDVAERARSPRKAEDPQMWQRIFGNTPVEGGDDDLLALAEKTDPPPLFAWCGTEDPLYDENLRFREVCERRGLPLTASFGPGTHEWVHWDEKIKDVLAWLPLR